MGIAAATHGKVRRSTRVLSEQVAAAADRRTLARPIAVKGISIGELQVIKPAQFTLLDVDPTYQRGETGMVSQILRALQAGGSVLDPVTLCIRKFGPRDGRMWIVDGYQRVCAFQQLSHPFQAMIHHSDSIQAESEFFISLNARRAVSSNVIVKAWNGPSAALLSKANGDQLHPMYERINFEQGSNANRFAASVVVRGLAYLTGSDHSMSINMQLSRLDTAMRMTMERARCEHFLRLLGMVCGPKGNVPAIVIRALGMVARERWHDDVYLPHQKVVDRLQKKQWTGDVILTEKYFSILVDSIRKIWRAQ